MDAIAEDMQEKVALFKALDTARERGATFLTTTSGLSITGAWTSERNRHTTGGDALLESAAPDAAGGSRAWGRVRS